MEKINLINDKFKIAQNQQKSQANKKKSDMQFNYGDYVLIKVSPIKGVYEV